MVAPVSCNIAIAFFEDSMYRNRFSRFPSIDASTSPETILCIDTHHCACMDVERENARVDYLGSFGMQLWNAKICFFIHFHHCQTLLHT